MKQAIGNLAMESFVGKEHCLEGIPVNLFKLLFSPPCIHLDFQAEGPDIFSPYRGDLKSHIGN
jgi:hypothetical protein